MTQTVPTVEARRVAISIVLFALLGAVLSAQATPTTSFQLQFFAPGVSTTTGTPFHVVTVPVGGTTCNRDPQVPVTTGVVANPKVAEWDDPSNTGKACQVTLDLTPVPFGTNYRLVLVAVDANGDLSDPSNAVPFDRRGKPATPQRLRGK